MASTYLLLTVWTGGGGVLVWGMFSQHTLCPFIQIQHYLELIIKLIFVDMVTFMGGTVV